MLQLRAQVKRGRNPIERQDPGHYIDLVAYWKEQFRQAQDECATLRTINIKLERSNHLLSSLTRTTSNAEISAQPSKRKTPTALPARSSKKARTTQKQAQQSAAAAQDTIENDSDFLELLGDGKWYPRLPPLAC